MTSTIGVKKIQHTNGTQVMTFDTAGKISSNVSSTGNITTTGTINTPSINGGQIGGRRNIVINGAMQIAQRATSETDLGASSKYSTLDRYAVTVGNTAGRFTMSQSAVTDLEGFSNALKIDCTTADTSVATNEYLIIQQYVEGFNLQQLKATSTTTRAFTLSFYAKSNASRAIASEINFSNGTNKSASKLHTIGTSWARYTMTVPAASSTQIDNDNSLECSINFWLHAGSTYSSGTMSASLEPITNANRAAGIGSIFASTANEIEITGIQLELGETATAFEHRSFGEELALCQRYFYAHADGRNGNDGHIGTGTYYTSSAIFSNVKFPVSMRTKPTLESPVGTNYYIAFRNGAGDHFDEIITFSNHTTTEIAELKGQTNVSGTAGHGTFLRLGGTSTTARLFFDAEL